MGSSLRLAGSMLEAYGLWLVVVPGVWELVLACWWVRLVPYMTGHRF